LLLCTTSNSRPEDHMPVMTLEIDMPPGLFDLENQPAAVWPPQAKPLAVAAAAVRQERPPPLPEELAEGKIRYAALSDESTDPRRAAAVSANEKQLIYELSVVTHGRIPLVLGVEADMYVWCDGRGERARSNSGQQRACLAISEAVCKR